MGTGLGVAYSAGRAAVSKSPSAAHQEERMPPTAPAVDPDLAAIAAATAGASPSSRAPRGRSGSASRRVPQIVTRGWLVDVAPLDPGEVIGVPDIDPAPGDAVLFHTGWGEHWYDPDTYLSGEPGPGMELAHWLVQRGVALTGCDTWSYGPLPAEAPDRPFEVPQFLNARHGVFIVENLDTAALARDGVREFALILTHPKLRGASGAWTSPIALV